MSIMENKSRNRNNTLCVRLSDTEKKIIKSKAKERSVSITDYILSVILIDEAENNEIYVEIMKRLRAVTRRLDLISGELNKAQQRSIDFEDVKDMQVEIKALVIELSAAQ